MYNKILNMKKVFKIILIIIAAIVLTVSISAIVCSTVIKITPYTASIDGFKKDARIVCISDLHSREYGKDNARLIAKVAEQKPDAIFVIGDMINADADEEDIKDMLSLMRKLGEIAQVYFSPGNQEMDYMYDTDAALLEHISETGAVTLWDSYVETEIAGNTVRVGGSLGHYYRYGWTGEMLYNSPDYAMEKEIGSTDVPALVLLHMPESLFTDDPDWWTGDLYLCGHTHGGVIRIPGIGGLYAPTQAFWPEYDRGRFNVCGQDFIITSGLSGYKGVPRIFNMPEICVVNIVSE